MDRSARSDLFREWNPGSSEEPDPKPADRTRSWPARPARPPRRDEPRGPDGPTPAAGPAADFTLHHGLGLGGGHRPGDDVGATIGGARAITAGVTAVAAGPGGAIAFPQCGDGIGGFRLVAELGRGAFGRVYLAEESGLGNRPVALKVTRAEGDEPRLLARLQHTHIVPIHSVRDDPDTGLRLLCMPYFGGANLAQVLGAIGATSPTEGAGRSLIEALDRVGQPAPSEATSPASLRRREGWPPPPPPASGQGLGPMPMPMPMPMPTAMPAGSSRSGSSAPLMSLLGRIPWWSRSLSTPPRPRLRLRLRSAPGDDRDPVQPARRFLREASFARAAVWIAARLAEGLEHAHSRGLLHRDLKPSNILIAADGTPMLLDFNLAAEAAGTAAGEGDRAMMGGTLPYMAPEHLDAFNPQGSTPPEAVDERADIYALGLILFEMVAGRHPFDEPEVGRPLLEVVAAMTRRRRQAAPSARSINPGVSPGLDAILRKALDPVPDRRHARAGDLAEDLRRFLDDRPLKYTPEPSVRERLAKWARRNPRATGASTIGVLAMALIVLVGGASWTLSRHLRLVSSRLRLRVFESRFHECQFLLNTAGGPVEHLGRGIGLAEGALAEAGVEARGRPADSWVDALPPAERDEIRRDLAELMLLAARARVFRAERSRSEPARRAALDGAIARLDRAEALDPTPTQALYDDRARYRDALGDAREAARDRLRRDATPPATGRDFYLIGTSFLARGRPDAAEPALLRAVGLDPRRFWSWFALGLCHYDQGRFAESAGDFAVCTVLAPRFAWPWMNRGLALARAGRLVEAREAYNRAIEVAPESADSRANRGLTALELGDAPAAVLDLERAIALGRRDMPIRAALAEALARAGRLDAGLAILADLIAAEPDAPLPRIARGTLLAADDPGAAEGDFRRVLARDPKHPAAHLGLARLFRKSDPKGALREADLALDGDPGRLDALELRALLRGRLGDPLALDDADRLVQAPTPHRLYNAACALGLLAESRPDPSLPPKALGLLRRALESGFPRGPLRDDPDLKSLRADPGFRALLANDEPPAGSP